MKVIENRSGNMKTVQDLLLELSKFPADKQVRFFSFIGREVEFFIFDYDEDEKGNPTFLLENVNAKVD